MGKERETERRGVPSSYVALLREKEREREREREREYEVFLSSTQGGKTRSFAFSKEPYTMQRANATVTSVSSRGAASLGGVSSRVISVRRTQHVVRASSQPQPQQQQEQKKQSDLVTKGAKTLAAIAIAATVSVADVHEAYAAKDISGLTKCAKSKPYAKREKQAVKALQKRLKKYEEGSAGANAINSSIAATKKRFKMYANSGVLCGKDGYPHLIADPGFALQYGHTGEILVPTFGFVYIAGIIGYAGRQYLLSLKDDKKPQTGEIIIDVPKALQFFGEAAVWPIKTYTELRNGTLLAGKDDITVSPR